MTADALVKNAVNQKIKKRDEYQRNVRGAHITVEMVIVFLA